MPTTSPSRNGMRHPQDSSAAAGIIAAKPAPTAEPSRMPPHAPRTHQATAAFRYTFDQEHHRAGVFSTDRKALNHAQQGEHNGCQKSERRVSRQQSDQKG